MAPAPPQLLNYGPVPNKCTHIYHSLAILQNLSHQSPLFSPITLALLYFVIYSSCNEI